MTRKPRERGTADRARRYVGDPEKMFTPETLANGVQVRKTPNADITTYRKLGMADDRSPWERQPDEPLMAYGWFTLYRDMNPQDRLVATVADRAGRTLAYLHKICGRDRWRERAAAWDIEKMRRFALEQDESRKRTARRHLRLSDAMVDVALKRVAAIDPEKLSLRDLPMFIDVATKIARSALGMDSPAVIAATQINIAQGSDVGSEERAAQEEAREVHERIKASLVELASRMTPEQRQVAAEAWGQQPGIIDGEVVPS